MRTNFDEIIETKRTFAKFLALNFEHTCCKYCIYHDSIKDDCCDEVQGCIKGIIQWLEQPCKRQLTVNELKEAKQFKSDGYNWLIADQSNVKYFKDKPHCIVGSRNGKISTVIFDTEESVNFINVSKYDYKYLDRYRAYLLDELIQDN